MTHVYPFLDGRTLAAIQQIVLSSDDPSFLTSEDCPYPDWFKDVLRKEEVASGGGSRIETVGEDENTPEYWIETILSDLKEFRNIGITALEPAQANTYIRSATALTEKLVAMRERLANVEMAQGFIAQVVNLLEEMVPQEIVGELMARLRRDIGSGAI